MSGDEKVKFVAVLLRDAAADFFDAFVSDDDDQGASHPITWEQFRKAFLQRFGRLQASFWRDVQQLFASPQRIDKTASDFISRLTRIAKKVKDIDDQMHHPCWSEAGATLARHLVTDLGTGRPHLVRTRR